MDSFMNYLSSHQATLMFSIFVALLIIYFLFKKFVNMALILALILLAVGGFLYLKNPKKMSESVMQTIEKVRTEAGKVIETSKTAYRDGKDLFEKGKKLPGEIDRLVQGKESEKRKEQ